MGPQGWAAVGKALGVAMAKWALDPHEGGAALLICQVKNHIMQKDFALAQVKLQHLKRHHTELYEQFIRDFGDELDSGELTQL